MSDAIQSATAGRTDDGPTTGGRVMTISESAVRQVRQMIERRADDTLILRVSVSGGGCSGFQYGIGFDNAVHEDDLVFERDGVRLAVDDVSLDLLDGSEVDFVEELIGASFQVRNPNAASSCGCGTSFSV